MVVDALLAHRSGVETSLGQIFQSIFDTVTLALILVKARQRSSSGLVALIAKQGLAYYMYVGFLPVKDLSDPSFRV